MTDNKTGQLIKFLQQEITMLDSLLTLLSDEKQTLIDRNYESMEKLAVEKEKISALLERSGKDRVDLLQVDKFDNEPKKALQAFLQQTSQQEAQQINQLNTQLAEKIGLCREKNLINGQVIVANINTRQEIVNILSGHNPETAINLYNSTGTVKNSPDTGKHEEA